MKYLYNTSVKLVSESHLRTISNSEALIDVLTSNNIASKAVLASIPSLEESYQSLALSIRELWETFCRYSSSGFG
jgi:hypothetical protein